VACHMIPGPDGASIAVYRHRRYASKNNMLHTYGCVQQTDM
jgi:hypothetical protein